jgi:DNA/RNA endonuclease YhcR with UshA esterase domain
VRIQIRVFLLPILFSFILLSCGKKEESPGELTDEKETVTETQITDTINNSSQSKQELKDSLNTYKNSYERLKPEKTITPLDAKDYIGKIVTVKGTVVEVNKREKVAYLNFVEKFPQTPFTGVIFSSRFEEFGNMGIFKDKRVEVTGRITTFKGKPQIILDSKTQIKILD